MLKLAAFLFASKTPLFEAIKNDVFDGVSKGSREDLF
jgi:hypothetical protein